MKKLLLLITGLLLLFSLEGQILRYSNYTAPEPPEEQEDWEVLLEGDNTIGWYIVGDGSSTYLATSSSDVTQFKDQTGLGHHLNSAAGHYPTFSTDYVEFNGTDDWAYAAAFTLSQPVFVYIVFYTIAATTGDIIYEGDNTNYCKLYYANDDGAVRMYAGSVGTQVTAAEETWIIVRSLFYSTGSSIQVGTSTAETGFDVGTNNMAGFTLGAGASLGSCANIRVKEIILRNVADDATNQGIIFDYLATKYSLYGY